MKIKICGIKDTQNAAELALLDIDFMGLIFAKSVRQVSLDEARNLSKIIKKGGKKVVGVFVDEDEAFILKAAQGCGLDALQIHRFIDKSLFNALKGLNLEVWQVISVGESLNLPAQIHADAVLFDAKGKLNGGNGVSFDWALLENLSLKNSDKKPLNFGLAGGLGLDNLKKALKTKASFLDFNSKTELASGLKDIAKVKEIVLQAKCALQSK